MSTLFTRYYPDARHYLMINTDILACAAGHTRTTFLEKVRIHPSTYYSHYTNNIDFTEGHVRKIESYISSFGDRWLDIIFKRACRRKLIRIDICKFGEVAFAKDESIQNILKTNLRAYRYFFGLPVHYLNYCAQDTINNIETGRKKVSDNLCNSLMCQIEDEARKLGEEYQRIFEDGKRYPITTPIPARIRF